MREDISPYAKPREHTRIKMHARGDPELNVDRTRDEAGHGERGQPGRRVRLERNRCGDGWRPIEEGATERNREEQIHFPGSEKTGKEGAGKRG